MSYSPQLQQRLLDALANKGTDYRPRTRHLRADGQPLYINRLIFEDSPYLLQHAHNPVDWYPWGEEAFDAAREQDKPVFLSIGYATCHWCHVMEEQSFESPAVAEVLNEHFISIKVDREQHPDIDATYMAAVTLFSGHGGWPMSSFLCPDGKPFFGGTYFPQANFIDVLTQINRAWRERREILINQAEQLADAVEQSSSVANQIAELDQNLPSRAIESILSSYDSRHGGFSSAPKFPHEPLLLLIVQILQRKPQTSLSAALQHTLQAMAQGGIYDQVGGGFHRYAVDQYWLVPHFEKMLYNQAYLARVYLQAFLLTGSSLFRRVVRQTLDYVLREMSDERGLFYSATDADSEGHEGTYFVWRIEEIRNLLPENDAQFIIDLFGVTPQGNFEGKNILFLPRSLAIVSQEQGQTLKQLCLRLDPLLEKLREHRRLRVPPLTDDKILVAWNGMMITAFAEAGHFLQVNDYIEAVECAAKTLWQTQRLENSLWRVNLRGKVSICARQDDYAHFAEAMLALYDVTDSQDYLLRARQLVDEMLDQFLDNSSGVLDMGNERLLFTQPKDSYDGALPSGNAVAVRVLTRLFRRTGEGAYLEHARNILRFYAGQMNRHPIAYAYMLAQLDELNLGEIGDCQYIADGSIKVSGKLSHSVEGRYEALIRLHCHESEWHFNGDPSITLGDQQDWEIRQINELQRSEGGYEIRLVVLPNDATEHFKPLTVQLTLQACDSQRCLPAEDIALRLYAVYGD
ncbi:thioredoxin domain-containing protein [Methylomarinum vadi]|uniref:thioredoxin domain-containing protein n=1 Tax=Methylomarinum vadi TaxID=438855 RepID=UPI0006907BF5|nr:thioredoxin domain-containing protein [Methylomarinum vadi]